MGIQFMLEFQNWLLVQVGNCIAAYADGAADFNEGAAAYMHHCEN
jgi:hypothetical protein